MKKELLSLGLVAALVAAPLAPASAHPWGWHGGGGLLFGLGAAVGAVAGAAATIAVAPFQAVGALAAPGPVYGGYAAPAYAAPVGYGYAAPIAVAAPYGYYGGYYGPRPVMVGGYYGHPYYGGYGRGGYARAGYYGHR